MNNKLLILCFLFLGLGFRGVTWAQTPWPNVQADNYPLVSGMKLVKHEQSILLGESDQQTGLFFARVGQAYSEQVQSQLVADAVRKGWKLYSVMRHGTQYVLNFSKSVRLLDIRLTNMPEGVEAVYSVVLSQGGGGFVDRSVASNTAPAGSPTPSPSTSPATSVSGTAPSASRLATTAAIEPSGQAR